MSSSFHRLVLEDDGERASYWGRRYQRIPEYRFSTQIIIKSVERLIRVDKSGLSNELEGIAFIGGRKRIRVMGDFFVGSQKLLVYFTLPYAVPVSLLDREDYWKFTREQKAAACGWPCTVTYTPGLVANFRINILVSEETLSQIIDVTTTPRVCSVRLTVHLKDLYVRYGKLQRGFPQGDHAYMLPKPRRGNVAPQSDGYVSKIEFEQKVKLTGF